MRFFAFMLLAMVYLGGAARTYHNPLAPEACQKEVACPFLWPVVLGAAICQWSMQLIEDERKRSEQR